MIEKFKHEVNEHVIAVLIYNLEQNISWFFHVLTQSPFASSETELDNCRQKVKVRVASKFAEWLKKMKKKGNKELTKQGNKETSRKSLKCLELKANHPLINEFLTLALEILISI